MKFMLLRCTWRVGAPGTVADTAIRHRPEARSTIAHAAQLSPDQLCQPARGTTLTYRLPSREILQYMYLPYPVRLCTGSTVAMYLDEV